MRSITIKMVLAFLGVGLTSIVFIVLLARWNTSAEFKNFLSRRNQAETVSTLEDYYQAHGSWSGVIDILPRPGNMQPGGPEEGRGPRFTLTDSTGQVILADPRYKAGDSIPRSELGACTPINVDGETVGFLLPGHFPMGQNPLEVAFLKRITYTLLYSALGAITVAFLLGILLSRELTRPIRELTSATRAVSDGNLGLNVPVRSHDELGELAESFNKMSADLARSTNARRQMMADIAHELRTPISLILGHAEAVHDRVLPPSLKTFEIIREETCRLEHLVDDLRILSLADAGELSFVPQLLAPSKLLNEIYAIYRHRARQKKVKIRVDAAHELPDIYADPGRITQVLTNVMDNALRHTPEGGQVALSARSAPGGIEMAITDSGPGVAEEDLPQIFERFYRPDPSRQRAEGGSGLGLAIAKSILEAHGGQIRAEGKLGKGLTIIIQLPAKK